VQLHSQTTIPETVQLTSEDADRLLRLQKEILELVATGQEHQFALDELCKTAEAMLPNSAASIMLYDEQHQSLIVHSAPSIPEHGILQLNGLVPGLEAGSCGTAVYKGEPQYVCDTSVDPRWRHFRQFAQDFNLCACWSVPIHSHHDEIIGSFALASFEHRDPSEFHKILLDTGASLAGIVLKRQAEEELLQHAAHYDHLTDLPNRVLFNIRLEHAIHQAKRDKTNLAILFIDLDNFKVINDTRGHEQGDQALIEVATRMRQIIREEDTLARLGGDEFVLLFEKDCSVDNLSQISEKILNCLEQPIILHHQKFKLSASIGISCYPHDGRNKDTLFKNADIAMYEAKSKGRNCYDFYQSEYTQQIKERVAIERELRRALDNNEFEVYYQPIIDVKTNTIVSAEALVRWQHPEKGILGPNLFISIAEQSGLIKELGQFIARKACIDGVKIHQNGYPDLQLSVNLSVKQLAPDCHQIFSEILSETHFPADKLQIEVTESLIMEHDSLAFPELDKLRQLGLQVAMDDFGTGHSSLAQLKALPMDKLKIDRTFIKDLPDNQDDIVLCQTIIAMGHNLGYSIIAEGVETEEQKTFLYEHQCDYLQGYLFSRPVPFEEFIRLL